MKKSLDTRLVLLSLICVAIFACKPQKETNAPKTISKVNIEGTMKDVMWKGIVEGDFSPQSINKKNIYGVGLANNMQGILAIYDGELLHAFIENDQININREVKISSPLFTYSEVANWEELSIPDMVKDLLDLEIFLGDRTKSYTLPIPLRIKGKIKSGQIHLPNLKDNKRITSPSVAYEIRKEFKVDASEVEMFGFYGKNYRGIFNYYDSDIHLFLKNEDTSILGHIDKATIDSVQLFIPDFVSEALK